MKKFKKFGPNTFICTKPDQPNELDNFVPSRVIVLRPFIPQTQEEIDAAEDALHQPIQLPDFPSEN